MPATAGPEVVPLLEENPLTGSRVAVPLIPAASAALGRLQDMTGLSKTDIMNRAIVTYEFVEHALRDEREVSIRDNRTGETFAVHFL
jgi:hypothetical protein